MKKRLLAAAVALCMLMVIMPGMALAATREVNDGAALTNAISSAVSGDTIQLTGSFEVTSNIIIQKTLTLDLNGQTLTLGTYSMIVDGTSGKLTIIDSQARDDALTIDEESDYAVTYSGTGKIVYTGGQTAILVQEGGSLTLESGMIDAHEAGNGIYVNGNKSGDATAVPVNSTLNLYGGYVYAREYGLGVAGVGAKLNISGGVVVSDDNTAVGGNGTVTSGNYHGGTVINIRGGTLIGHIQSYRETVPYIACGIYHPQDGVLNISGGTIYAGGTDLDNKLRSGVGILMRGGVLNLSGGTVIATGEEDGLVGDSKVVVGGSAVLFDQQSSYYDNSNVEVLISGGELQSSEGVSTVAVCAVDGEETTASEVITITGGQYSNTTNLSSFLADNFTISGQDVVLGYADAGIAVSGDTYSISTLEGLRAFRDSVNAGNTYAGKTVLLTDNISLAGEEWVPIGTTIAGFQGTFDGQNHTISGLTMTSADTDKPYYNAMDTGDYYAYGFFGGIRHATVKNINFTEVSINQPGGASVETATQNNTVGTAVGAVLNGSTVENITVSGEVIGYSRVGGIVGYMGGSKSAASDTLITGEDVFSMGTITVKGCTNNADVTSMRTASSHGTAGGICSTVNIKDSTDGAIVFEGNTNNGDTVGYFSAGILASSFADKDTPADVRLEILGNTNTGDIEVNSAISSPLETPTAVGITVGTVGARTGCSAVLRGNVNRGTVTASVEKGVAAGISGSIYPTTRFEGTNANYGAISGTSQAAGIVTNCFGAELTGLVNGGTVTATGTVTYTQTNEGDSVTVDGPRAGGIVATIGNSGLTGGSLDGSTCSNTGNVSVPSASESPFVGSLAGYVGIATVKNVEDAGAIGAVRVTGNDSYTTTLDRVQVDKLNVVAGHTQSFTYTLSLINSSSIGTVSVAGEVHTGMTLAISGGEADTVTFEGITDHSNTGTNLSFAAVNGAQIGTVDTADDSNKLTSGLYIAAVNGEDGEASSIGQVRTGAPVTVGFVHTASVNSDGRAFASTGTIGSVVTTNTSYTNNSTLEGNRGAEEVLYQTSELAGAASDILSGADSAPDNFTGVSLSGNVTLNSELAIADGRTLVVEKNVNLDLSGGSADNHGVIRNYGIIKVTSEDAADSLGKVQNYDAGKVVYGDGNTPTDGENITYAVTFDVTPADAVVTVTDSNGAAVVGSGNVYQLSAGEYSYTVTASSYTSQNGSFTVELAAQTITVMLSQPPVNPTYTITNPSVSGGTVTVSPRSASRGRLVTLTVTPDEGYELASLTVTDSRGSTVTLTDAGNGKYTFTMPGSRVVVNASFQLASLPFTDVAEGAWYYDAVAYVYRNGLMAGVSSTQFAPDSTLNRATLATILWRLAGEPVVNYVLPFEDVAEGEWYSEAVRWAASTGIVNGTTPTTFRPFNSVTREQMAAMVHRYAEYMGYDTTASTDLGAFTDASSVNSYAAEPMGWCVAEGLISGIGTEIRPQSSATRAQIATMLMRFCENVAK